MDSSYENTDFRKNFQKYIIEYETEPSNNFNYDKECGTGENQHMLKKGKSNVD